MSKWKRDKDNWRPLSILPYFLHVFLEDNYITSGHTLYVRCTSVIFLIWKAAQDVFMIEVRFWDIFQVVPFATLLHQYRVYIMFLFTLVEYRRLILFVFRSCRDFSSAGEGVRKEGGPHVSSERKSTELGNPQLFIPTKL